jgi:hypothetical protein
MPKLNWYENTESDIVNNLGRGGRYGPDYVADLDPEGEYKAVIVPHSKGIWRWHIIRYDGEELSGGVAMSREEAEAAVVKATSWPGGYEQKEFDDIERQMDEKQGSRKRSAGQLTEQQAQQALEMVKQYFRVYIDKDNSPKLIMDWDWFGTGPSPSIVWEEGPYEWAIQYTGEHNRFPKGVYGEPATNWALSLYPEELDYSQNGKDDASYSEIDPEMEYWMQEFKNSSADVELFTNFTPTFEKDSGVKIKRAMAQRFPLNPEYEEKARNIVNSFIDKALKNNKSEEFRGYLPGHEYEQDFYTAADKNELEHDAVYYIMKEFGVSSDTDENFDYNQLLDWVTDIVNNSPIGQNISLTKEFNQSMKNTGLW